jgi:hypothetical protein
MITHSYDYLMIDLKSLQDFNCSELT